MGGTRTCRAFGVLALLAGLAACGSTEPSSAGAGGSLSAVVVRDDALAAMVPDEVAADGVLSIGTDASYPPAEFLDADGAIVGFDVDLASAVAAVLGLTAEFEDAAFDSVVAGVQYGWFELGVSALTITPERLQRVDMPSYFRAGTSWAVSAGNPQGVTPDDACGHRVAVQRATVQVGDLRDRSMGCEDAGKKRITVVQYPRQDDATGAVIRGEADAMLADSPVVAHAIQAADDRLQFTGRTYGVAPYGYAVAKGGFAAAVQGALQKLMDDGTYEEVLSAWGVQIGAVTTSELNPPS